MPFYGSYTGFAGGGVKAPITFAYTANHSENSQSTTSVTDSGAALGTAAANRQILVGTFAGRSGSGTSLVTGITVAGVTATELQQTGRTGGNPFRSCSAIYIATVPSGTTGDVVVTFSGTQYDIGIYTIAIYGAASTAFDTGTAQGQASNLVLSDTVNIPANGFAIAMVGGSSGSLSNYTWVGLTEGSGTGAEVQGGSTRYGLAANTDMSVETGRTIQSTATGTQNDACLSVVSLAQA